MAALNPEAQTQNQPEFRQRAVSGLVIAAVIVGGIYLGGWAWNIIAAALALLSLAEYYRLLGKRVKLSKGIGYLCAVGVLFSGVEGVRPTSVLLFFSIGVYAVFLIEMVRRQMFEKGKSYAVDNVGGTLSGVFFIVVPWTCILLLRSLFTGRAVLLILFACTWGCDVMAYLVGRRWGKRKLCEQVSPGKTVAGFAAGAVGSLFAAAAVIYLLNLPAYPFILIGFICGVAGQLGDLAESLVKREVGEKDSGHLIPGHGGVLDRFDSILVSGLLTYLLMGVLM